MSNNVNLFKALSSSSRIKILRIIANKELHLSEISRQLKISKPVISRHIKILEKAGLVKRNVIGNMHLFSANMKVLEKAFEPFIEQYRIEIRKNMSIFDALKQLPNIKTKSQGKHKYVTSIDDEEGYYIYEVDGKIPKKPIDGYKPNKDSILKIKKLITVDKKRIKINVKEK